MKHRILPQDVTAGMFICGFGGGWLNHPFWVKRFEVKPRHLRRLAESAVPFVIIDDEKGPGPAEAAQDSPSTASASAQARPCDDGKESIRPLRSRKPGGPSRGSYSAAPARNSKRAEAKRLLARSLAVTRETFANIRSGKPIRMAEVSDVVEDIVGSTAQCPRALLEVLRLKQKDEYTYLHSVAVCTLMINVARQLGKDEAEVFDYGLAGLFHDLGKMCVDQAILDKPGSLDEAEFDAVRTHPIQGYDILARTSGVPAIALDVCRHHHERPDGKGYPSGLSGAELSEAARLGAICDVYDALTSDRAYKDAWSPSKAMTAMWGWEGQFDRELLFAFMQSVGVYPEGLVVELDGDRLGLVLAPRSDGQRSRVLVFFCTATGRPIAAKDASTAGKRDSVAILAPADPQAYGIAPELCSEAHLRGVEWTRKPVATLAV
ncbi:HD-GYP domain-containing protein [Qipengyuania sp. YG27]|uniref:HD-GYP domain-containing protein n=1 Tax=Qipengyuania mesophila TaxID=2867246 RepID=A0ABS7JQS8_9SPHN|nr:HD-GYP domain-containing protein [Qipengyuania mesophila]MBX7499977.1 HD-GYP domain-containing protein [Qipengyuania mesophila]